MATVSSFDYKVRDSLGGTQEGTLEASSLEAAELQLRKSGFQVLELEEESGGIALFARSIRSSDIIYVTSQLAVMVDTGITLATALQHITQQCDHPALKKLLLDLKQRVESGEDFSFALSQYPQHFDKTFVALVRASEHTGTLGSMLETISDSLRRQMDTYQKVTGALMYPGVMLGLAVTVTLFLLTSILPKFAPLFRRRNINLPTVTKVMMGASDLLLQYWHLWIVALVAVIIGFVLFRRTTQGKWTLDWLKINTPIIGTMIRKLAISRSIRTLGTMIGSGVSVLDAIRLASEVSGNLYYEQLWKEVLEKITHGEKICDALAGRTLIPSSVVQMIGAGEETGKLDHVLQKVSSFYDREVELSIKSTTSLIEPLMIVGMGVVVGTIAMGLLLPIFQLSKPH